MPRSWLYTPLRTFDPEINPGTEKPPAGFLVTRKVRILLLLLLVFSALFSFGAGLTGSFSITYRHDNKPPTSCLSAPKRREWRSLSRSEKTEYINAVQCLRTTPSVLSLPQTLYDDFPYVHMHVGNATHDTAGFLPWHRYFLHVYETALRNWCNYTGQLTYWDWTLDWADFRSAPVWDAETGFGGDGGLDAPRSVGEGRCVVDGPFAGLKALYSNLRKRPHCLARGFPGEKELKRWNAEFTPEKVEAVLGAKRYEDFNLGLENGPHLAIPYSVRGDFYRFTAPYGRLST